MKVTIDIPLIISPITSFHAYLAAKMPHSWCGGGGLSPLPVYDTEAAAGCAKIEKEEQEPALEEANNGIILWLLPYCSRGRPPPRNLNIVRELFEDLQYGLE